MKFSRISRTCVRCLFGALVFATAFPGALAQEVKVLSSRADSISGGDAVIQVRIPSTVSVLQVAVLRNGVDVTSAFVATDTTTLQGLVSGLNAGLNVILATARSDGRILAKAIVQNWPIYGPIFAGSHQRPWICETDTSGLGPPPASGPCVGPTRYDWFYRTTTGTFAPLPSLSPPFPSDLAQTTTIDGRTVNYIVRVESGVIDESIYRIAIIDDPTNPIMNPWSPGGKKPGPGWNGKLFYYYIGGAGPGYRSGRNTVTAPLLISDSIIATDDPLNLGYAVAFGTRNTFGTGADDLVSAETTMMIKERFIKQYGMPRYTVGLGSSGGSMQQHLIAHGYPGLLDAIIPVRTFPDLVTIVPDVLDCGLLGNYFTHIANPANWPGSRITKVDGFALLPDGTTTCQTGWGGFANQWQNPNNGFDPVVPVALRYNPITNRTGARSTYWDGQVNVYGIDPNTGFARSGYDNIGVQYGLRALNNGDITKAEFLDLNERIGGLDIDGNIVSNRSTGDLQAISSAYRSGRVNSGENLTLPLIDYRNYVDNTGGGNIHSRHRTFQKLARLQKTNGTTANAVVWTITNGAPASPDLMRLALLAHNEWLENILADTSTDSYAVKVVRNKPATLKDACWDSAGVKHEEPATVDGTGVCNTLFPVHADVRIFAGGPLAGDILKCQVKPVTASDYAVTFTPAELVRLNSIFPQGVCDWSKPGVNQSPLDDSWLRYVPPAGTWVRMGHTSFGNN